MVNFIIQYNFDGFNFANDHTHEYLNHFDYKHFEYFINNFV